MITKTVFPFLHRYRVCLMAIEIIKLKAIFSNSAYRVMHASDPVDSIVTKNIHGDFAESYKIFELRFKYFALKRLELNVLCLY